MYENITTTRITLQNNNDYIIRNLVPVTPRNNVAVYTRHVCLHLKVVLLCRRERPALIGLWKC